MTKIFQEEITDTSAIKNSDALETLVNERGAEYNCFPLSRTQERLWFLSQIMPDNSAYNIAGAVRLKGDLNKAALERSLSEIIRRHEILRTSFIQIGATPFQRIHEETKFKLEETDLAANSGEQVTEETITRELKNEASRGFLLSEPGLLRVRLFIVGRNEYVLMLVMHHIIGDGWSLGVLMQELKDLYEAFCKGAASPLPELEIQYVDYAAWERELLASGELQQGLEFWKQHLAGAPPLIELPFDYPRSVTPSFRGSAVNFTINPEVCQKLRQLGTREGATLYMVLLAAFQSLLWRYTGQKDIVVGSPVAERQQIEMERLIGLFVNLVPRRMQFQRNDTFLNVLQRVKQAVLDAQPFQHVPFEKVVEQLEQERVLNHMPLVQVVFAWQGDMIGSLHLGEMTGRSQQVETGTSKFDLTLTMEENGESLQGGLEYSTDLFYAATIRQMVDHYVRLLKLIAAEPQAQVAALPLLREIEVEQLSRWSKRETQYPREKTIAELFEETAASFPEAIALSCGDEQLRYSELNQQANQVASYLRLLGVGPEVTVGICMERSMQMITAILGILKAGGVYVPFDPSYPEDRLRFTLEDSGVSILLTQEHLQKRIPPEKITSVCLDRDWSRFNSQPVTNPMAGTLPENLAYLMYTSGSTGKPKGAAITHRGVVRLVRNTNYAEFSNDETFLQFAPTSFDASTLEIWGPLLNGAKLVIFAGKTASVEDLGRELKRHNVTTLWLTAGLFHLMVEERIEDLKGVRQLLAGGDVLRVDAVEKVRTTLPGCCLINGYGPTEDTTFTCCFPVKPEVGIRNSVPIGFPIANTSVFILDEDMNPVPPGVTGQLYIGGDGLARGYWKHPEITAEKFVPDPASGAAGARLYDSGDCARWTLDGTIEFLGRADQQVKIRGFRVEPEEVEAILKQCAGVRECAVVVKGEGAAEKRLIAYVTAQGPELNLAELREYARAVLPGYMLPSAFMPVEQLPLTPNGKLDRKALPEPNFRDEAETQEVLGETERAIAEIWSQLLGATEIRRNDNFFELGGHSLLATRLSLRLSRIYECDVPLAMVFEFSTLKDLAAKLDELVSGLRPPQLQMIQRVSRDKDLPLSSAQERLWFLHQLMPSSTAYNVAGAIYLSGNVDTEALEQSFLEIIRRHEILRTSFIESEAGPIQRVHAQSTFKLQQQDLRTPVAGTASSERVQREIQREAKCPFWLDQPELFRAKLLQMGDSENVLVLVMHHIVADGWSIGVLATELESLYQAFCTGAVPALPELGIQYADYAVWQRQLATNSAMSSGLQYWKEQLAGAPQVLALPADFAPTAESSQHGSVLRFTLGKELTAKLKDFTRQAGATLNMTLLAAFQVLLAHYTGREDIVVGSPVAGREQLQTEKLIGMLVNLVALRTHVSANHSFVELVQQVRQTVIEAQKYQFVPFEKVIEEIEVSGAASHMPVVQVVFAWQSDLPGRVKLGEAAGEIQEVSADSAKFELTLTMREQDGLIHAAMEYSTDLFRAETIERMAGHYVRLITGAASHPASRISEIQFMSTAEQEQILAWSRGAQLEQVREGTALDLFTLNAQQLPTQDAIESAEARLTYEQLDRRSNQLARYLREAGVRDESLVALCMSRSPEMIVAMLAVLKAGAAYVSLDPSYPPERLRYMLDDARVQLVCTQTQLMEKCAGSGRATVVIDQDWPSITSQSSFPLSIQISGERLAYVIYTSGSTGRPKGVQVTHKGLHNLVQWHRLAFGLTSGDRTTQVASIGFDASVWEIWSSLASGATLCFTPEEVRFAPAKLRDWLVAEKITASFLPTPLAEEIITLEWPEETSLRTLLTGGDKLRNPLRTELPFRFFNNYGPTECAVVATSALVAVGHSLQDAPSIGHAISNAQVYVLDKELHLVPAGVPGEIYIGGAGVARGYWQKPEMTAERFIPDPFSNMLGMRLYRTGDLASYLPDGQLKFLGRADEQVKLRGYRIELQEIAEVLRRAEGIRDAVVMVRGGEDATSQARLIAYIVGDGLDRNQLREHARQQLPDYMVPSAFVLLDKLPLTSNGKLDKKALPEPEMAVECEELSSPATATEEIIGGVWAELLGAGKIGRCSNFFELGGHSLLATQMNLRLESLFNCKVPLRTIFESPTLETLAARIDALVRGGQIASAAPIPRALRDENLPLSSAQERLWLLDRIIPNSSVYNIPGAIRLRGELDKHALERSLKEIIQRHEVLRTSFVQTGRKPYQRIHDSIDFELQYADFRQEADIEEKLRQELQAEASRGFMLNAPNLLRPRLFDMGDHDHVLLLVVHHIVADGWSLGILLRELTELYAVHAEGRSSTLPELKIQYADYAAWQREMLASGEMSDDLTYWKQKLAGVPPVLEIPTDHARPAVQSFRGAVEQKNFSEKISNQLKSISQTHGVTLFMTLLAGFQILLARYSGQKDIAVGSPIANRARTELENLIGFFVNVLALRGDLGGDPQLAEVLKRTREVCLGAYAHQTLPFDKLVEELEPERDLSRNPLFQVLFVLQNTPTGNMQLPGIEVAPVPIPSTVAKFDLSLAIEENAEGLRATLEFNTDLFDRTTARQLLKHYGQVLEAIVSDAGQRLSQLTLLDADEIRQLSCDWNQTHTKWDVKEETVVQLIELQVAQQPSAVALEFEGQELSYRELNHKANQVARYLQRQGVRPEGRVALCLERSLEMVIAIVGVLKAGAAYVPVDESYPEDRVKYMLVDAGAELVLTQEKVKDRLQGLTGNHVRWISLDSEWAEISTESGGNLNLSIHSGNLAYVIYTSGSTGMPKGAMNTHEGLLNRLLWMQQAYGLTPKDRVLQKTPFSFDVSVWEFLWPLMQGARLVVARPGGHRDPAYLVNLIRKAGITTLHFVPSMLQAFVAQDGVENCTSIKRVIASGEALPLELVEKWEKKHPAELHNLYGPTEASIDVSYWPCRVKKEWGIPIGLSIANIQLHVVDEYGQLAPPGVIGELHIGGIGLARGYWNRASLTAERFVPDPFSGKGGARLYRTGDRARFHADGVLEYMGRADEQVKIRGHRIELGEIESALRQHPSVTEAAVLVREWRPGDKRLAAYVAVTGYDHFGAGEIRSMKEDLQTMLKKRLPEYMMPSNWVLLEHFPLSPNGKLDRKALLKLESAKHHAEDIRQPGTGTEKIIAELWKQILGASEIGIEDNFFDAGGHSLLLAQVHKGLQEAFGTEIQLMELFQYPSIRALAEHLDQKFHRNLPAAVTVPAVAAESKACSEFAIVGMSCRFPGARNVDEFWRNLQDGVESVSDFTDEELRAAGVSEELLSSPDFVRRGAILNDIDLFDARFFNFSAREAEMTDPQHRVFLECAWEALEHAGYNPDAYPGHVGVYAGSFASTYFMNLYADPEVMKSADGFALFFANGNDFLATRVSYKLNLTGPSMTVQSGCSTSLVAVHLACKALMNGECDMALAGGVAIKTPERTGYQYQEGGIFSPDGHCRSFDARAQGTIGGNGAGIVVIKRLADAIRDRDHIHAIIKGSGANNDGADKPGYTAPGIHGQRAALLEAYRVSGVSPETISYIEAHGTATALGDPVEFTALTQAFQNFTQKSGFCAIGSVKTNVGHLDTAAGVAGVIKTALSLEHKLIPPSLHFEEPNPKIDFASSPFYVNTALADWKAGETARRAGVSSFGIGGTNVHVVMEEPPEQESRSQSRPWQLILLSAKSNNALEQATDNLVAHLDSHRSQNLADIAYTLQVGRKAFSRRRFIVAQEIAEVHESLRLRNDKTMVTCAAPDKPARVAFMFPGQGSQYVNMGKELYAYEPVFREQVDRCAEILKQHLHMDLRELLYPTDEKRKWAEAELAETRITQPALFVIEYALATLWMSWGIMPDTLVGHSIGEYAAACVAGVFSLEDALALVSLRGRCMQKCERGAMLAVMAAETELQEYLKAGADLAAVNGTRACVLAGPDSLIDGIEKKLAKRSIVYRRLHSSHAFHSRMMDPIVDEFVAAVRGLELHAPKMRYISSLTGEWIAPDEVTNPDYWGRQLRGTVQFAKAISRLCDSSERIVLEVGPGHSGSTSIRGTLPKAALPVMLSSLAQPKTGEPESKHLLTVLGTLWAHGAEVDWNAFAAGEERRRVVLPFYPFQRQRYWIETSGRASNSSRPNTSRKELKDWLYVPCWKETPLVSSDIKSGAGTRVLIFADDLGLSRKISDLLEKKQYEVITVTAGRNFSRIRDSVYCLRSDERQHYDALMAELRERNQVPHKVVHLWNVSVGERINVLDETDLDLDFSFFSLANLFQSIESNEIKDPVQCLVISNGVHEITGTEVLSPGQAALLGLCNTISREMPNLTCNSIDIDVPAAKSRHERFLIDQLIAEIETSGSQPVVAYRGARRWIRSFDPLPLPGDDGIASLVHDGGIYLITGGLSEMGFKIAQWIRSISRSHLVLVDRAPFPSPDQWNLWIETQRTDDPAAKKIKEFQQWQKNGSQISIYQADIADESEMRQIESRVCWSAGKVNGIIHASAFSAKGRLISKTAGAMAKVLDPKVKGTLVINDVFSSSELKFMVLCSSLNSITGSPEQADQAAANTFLDAFARQRMFQDQCFTTSINWEDWNDGPGEPSRGIKTEEAVEVLKRVLAAQIGPQAIISSRDLNSMIAAVEPEAGNEKPAERTYSRPELERPFSPPTNDAEALLVRIWTDVLGISPIGIDDNFFELGGDSLIALKMAARARELGANIAIEELFRMPTIQQLAKLVAPAGPSDEGPQAQGIPMLATQEQMLAGQTYGSRSVVLNVAADMESDKFAKVFEEIVAAHDSLRLRFSRSETGWQQSVAPVHECMPFAEKDLSDMQESEQRPAIELAIAELQGTLHPEQRVFQAVLFRIGDSKPCCLFIQALELVADAASLKLLLDEIETRYFNHLGVSSFGAPALNSGFCRWATALERHAKSEIVPEVETRRSRMALVAPKLPVDLPDGSNTRASLATYAVSLNAEQSCQLLQDLPEKFHCGADVVILTGVVQALLRWTGKKNMLLDTVTDGRTMKLDTPVQIDGAIGNFSVVTPGSFSLDKSAKGPAALKLMKEQWLSISNDAMTESLLLSAEGTYHLADGLPQLRFTYAGQRNFFAASSGSFQMAQEQWNDPWSAVSERRYLLEVFVTVKDGRLSMKWLYSRNIHRERTIQRLAESCIECLNSLAAACLTESVATYTPSDFPEAQLSQKDLDSLMAEIAAMRD